MLKRQLSELEEKNREKLKDEKKKHLQMVEKIEKERKTHVELLVGR